MAHLARVSAAACIMLAFGLTLVTGRSHAAEPTAMRVNAFPNAKALPLHAGIAKGIFARRGFAIELHLTENSRSQREGLAAAKFEVVHSAVDNAVAMIEVAKHDVVIVSGGDSGMNEFFVQADIKSFADLRGRTIVVDAPDTAYALQAKKILLQHGLKDGGLHGQAGGCRRLPLQGDAGGQEQRRRHPQSAVHRAGRAGSA